MTNAKRRFLFSWAALSLTILACATQSGPAVGDNPSTSPASSPTHTATPSASATPTLTPVPTSTPLPSNTPEPTVSQSVAYALEVVALVNEERALHEVPALSINWTLMANAGDWSAFMAENNVFYHSGYQVGENVGAGYESPGEVVAGWMNSSGHRANILDPSFTQAGAGYAYSSESTFKHYWTLQFSP
jgi:uncharacterized protein YkwD